MKMETIIKLIKAYEDKKVTEIILKSLEDGMEKAVNNPRLTLTKFNIYNENIEDAKKNLEHAEEMFRNLTIDNYEFWDNLVSELKQIKPADREVIPAGQGQREK